MRICPQSTGLKTVERQLGADLCRVKLPRNLGVDGLPGAKRNLQIELSDRHLLCDVAAQVHLDLVYPLIVKGQVGEGGQVEAGLEFSIQALQ